MVDIRNKNYSYEEYENYCKGIVYQLLQLINMPIITGNVCGSTYETNVNDKKLVGRIIRSYQKAQELYIEESGETWGGWLWNAKQDVHAAFIEGDLNRVSELLRKPIRSNLLMGYEELYRDNALDYSNFRTSNGYYRLLYDCLFGLAVITDAVRIQNPERVESLADEYAKEIIDVDTLLKLISEKIEFEISFPNPFPQEIGIKTGRGIASYRAIQAVYQAYRIVELVGNRANARVLEIGAGLGRTAYYASQMGVKNYTIVDLPITNVAQAYFLGRTLGDDHIRIEGEVGNVHNHEDSINIMPPYYLDNNPSDHYDLVINADSLTEMDDSYQEYYSDYIKKHCDCFLSINHEANKHTVNEIINHCNRTRTLYPLRRGYVEEVYYF